MSHDFAEFRELGEVTLTWLKKEYTAIHTGRAMPSILDRISVDAYGSLMTINQLATVSVEDPKTLRLTPWDKEVTKNIDRAIRESNLGLSVALDSTGLRVSFPELTSERRAMLSKLIKEKLEAARIKIRAEREKNLSIIDQREKEGILSKDDEFRLRDELQKLVDATNQGLETLALKKEKEILE